MEPVVVSILNISKSSVDETCQKTSKPLLLPSQVFLENDVNQLVGYITVIVSTWLHYY